MIRLLFDFGLVVLVWIVQLVVYPSFKYFHKDDLLRWHGRYTKAITVIVLPLMVGQLCFHSYALFNGFKWLNLLLSGLVLMTWMITFLFAVPLHNKISTDNQIKLSTIALERVNWYRTMLWSVIFLISFISF